MINLNKLVAAAAMFALLPLPAERAAAEVINVASNGFEVRETVHVAAAPDKAYAALLLPGRWWSPDHSFSHNAANFVLDARAGGCWCENFPDGGSAEFM